MQTIRGQKMISPTAFNHTFSPSPVSASQAKRLKIREFISWSVCFAVVSSITGLIKFLKVGVTMESVTSVLFYLSLSGFVYFLSRTIKLSRTPVRAESRVLHELN